MSSQCRGRSPGVPEPAQSPATVIHPEVVPTALLGCDRVETRGDQVTEQGEFGKWRSGQYLVEVMHTAAPARRGGPTAFMQEHRQGPAPTLICLDLAQQVTEAMAL